MKQIKLSGIITKITQDTITAEQARELIRDLEIQLDAPEPVEFWEGQLVEVYDSSFMGVIKRFNRKSGNGCFDMQNAHWNCCRPLQDPLILQFKAHMPSAMPCDGGLMVRVLLRCGAVRTDKAKVLDWGRYEDGADIIGWMPADGWGGGE